MVRIQPEHLTQRVLAHMIMTRRLQLPHTRITHPLQAQARNNNTTTLAMDMEPDKVNTIHPQVLHGQLRARRMDIRSTSNPAQGKHMVLRGILVHKSRIIWFTTKSSRSTGHATGHSAGHGASHTASHGATRTPQQTAPRGYYLASDGNCKANRHLGSCSTDICF